MLDAITLERRGVPTAAVGVRSLAMTTGRGMARALGFPDLRIAMIDNAVGQLEGYLSPEEINRLASEAAPQVESILTGRTG